MTTAPTNLVYLYTTSPKFASITHLAHASVHPHFYMVLVLALVLVESTVLV